MILSSTPFRHGSAHIAPKPDNILATTIMNHNAEVNDMLKTNYIRTKPKEGLSLIDLIEEKKDKFWMNHPTELINVTTVYDFIPSSTAGNYVQYLNSIVRLAVVIFILVFAITNSKWSILIVTLALLLTLYMYVYREKFTQRTTSLDVDSYIDDAKNRIITGSLYTTVEEGVSSYNQQTDTLQKRLLESPVTGAEEYLYNLTPRRNNTDIYHH